MNVKLLFLVVIIISFVIAFYIKSFLEHRRLEELYSRFTNYMKETVEQRLSLIDCKPKKFYFEDSVVCFVCNVGDACFNYKLLPEGRRIAMTYNNSVYMRNVKRIDLKVGSSYTNGLIDLFDCQGEDERISCYPSLELSIQDDKAKLVVNDESKLSLIAGIICSKLFDRQSACNVEMKTCGCEDTGITIRIVNRTLEVGGFVDLNMTRMVKYV